MSLIETVDLGGMRPAVNPLKLPVFTPTSVSNMLSRNKGVLKTRPGFVRYGTLLDKPVTSMFTFPGDAVDRVMLLKGLAGGDTIMYDSDLAGTWASAGSFVPQGGILSNAFLNGNLYLNGYDGLKKTTAYNSSISAAGAPKGLDGSAAVNAGGSILANNKQVAYRVVWGITDANGNKIVGTPSQRIIVSNTAGAARDVDLNFSIPSGITTSHFYQIYRSGQADTTVEPDDELQLVVEKAPTAAEITAKAVSYTDSVADSILGAALYTSPSQEGILQSNDRPPLADCICAYRDMMLFGKISYLHGMSIGLAAIGGSGMALNDTLTVYSSTYTAKAAENIALREFQLYTGGTAAQNIENTAKSLVKVINRDSGNTLIYAYYVSGYGEDPGKIRIEARAHPSATFYATASTGTGTFSPAIPLGGTTYASSADSYSNGIAVSKNGQPEASPTLNRLFVGSQGTINVRQIIALRESAIVLTDGGAYRINGDSPGNLSVTLLDLGVNLTAASTDGVTYRRAATVLDNVIYMSTRQGIVAINESGVDLISDEMKEQTSFPGVLLFGHEQFKELYIAPGNFTYNIATDSWATWSLTGYTVAAGTSSRTGYKVYLAESGSLPYVRRLRDPSSDPGAYADQQLTVTISSATGATVSVTATVGVSAGWTLAQDSISSVIVSVDAIASTFTVRDTGLAWTAATAIAYEPIPGSITFAPQHHNSPMQSKLWKRVCAFLKAPRFDQLTMSLGTELSVTQEDVVLVPHKTLPYQTIGTFVPLSKNRGHYLQASLSHSHALKPLELVGMGAEAEIVSTKTRS